MPKADRRIIRNRIHLRIRKKISGTAERPRLSVFFSGKHVYAQIIEDAAGHTLAAVNTTEADFRKEKTTRANIPTAQKVGTLVAERAKAKGISPRGIRPWRCAVPRQGQGAGRCRARRWPRFLNLPFSTNSSAT